MDRVLLVNDCRFESMIIKDILEDLGYEVNISSEFNALEDISNYSPNLVICNLIMKKTTGDKLIQKFKERDPKLKCILSSSNDLKVEDFKKYNVDSIIKTPITKDKLKEVIEKNRASNNVDLELLKSIIAENKKERKKEFTFCPYCGEKLDGVYKFCPYCGNKM